MMLKFINDNGVLFSGIFSVITALIAVLVAVIKDNKVYRKETIHSLKKELKDVQDELEITKSKLHDALSVEKAEESIDKAKGSVYYEKFSNGDSRPICGFCWEKEHVKIPLNIGLDYDEDTKQTYCGGRCNVCNSYCQENIDYEPTEKNNNVDNELPF